MFQFSLIALLTPLFSLLMLFRAFSLFRKKKQTWREFLLWTLLWSGIGIIAFWPGLLDYLPPYIGIKSGVNILVFFGFIVLFYGFFRLFIKVEDMERKFVELNREMAVRDSKECKEFNEYNDYKDLKDVKDFKEGDIE